MGIYKTSLHLKFLHQGGCDKDAVTCFLSLNMERLQKGYSKTIIQQGAFNDLSIGGASFIIKSSSYEYARSLLGSKAIIKLTLKNSDHESMEVKEGYIVSLCDHLFDNYLLSFRFNTPLSKNILHLLSKESN
jgi:hypothetical protein